MIALFEKKSFEFHCFGPRAATRFGSIVILRIMKIGLLTFHFSENYGALLQAFCLQEYLRAIGHEVEFINYHPYHVEQGGSIGEILKPSFSRRYLKKLYLFVNFNRQKYFRNPSAIAGLELFRRERLSISSAMSRTAGELLGKLGSYGHIFVGSDQIWNPSDQYGPDPVYYGYPFSADIPVSSYAASFGSVDRIKNFKPQILPFLRSLANCSVREVDAYHYLLSLGVKTSLVPDPTLLIDNLGIYKKCPVGVDLGNSIFTYALRSCAGVREAAVSLSSSLGFQLVSAYTPWRRWNRIGTEISLDPFSFLGSISASKLVVSNSFHGIVCSILLRKQFIAMALPGGKSGLSSRVHSFLQSVGLENRLIHPLDTTKVKALASQRINWDDVDVKITELRDIGRSYIMSSLGTFQSDKPPVS